SNTINEKKMMLAMSGFLRPYLSASIPKSKAPKGRMARVAVMLHTIALFCTPKCWARTSTIKTTTKKSKASSVHPRYAAVTACAALCGAVSLVFAIPSLSCGSPDFRTVIGKRLDLCQLAFAHLCDPYCRGMVELPDKSHS